MFKCWSCQSLQKEKWNLHELVQKFYPLSSRLQFHQLVKGKGKGKGKDLEMAFFFLVMDMDMFLINEQILSLCFVLLFIVGQ